MIKNKKFTWLVTLVFLAGLVFGVFGMPNESLASCAPSPDTHVNPVLSSLTSPAGTYTDISSPISFNVTGMTAYVCSGSGGGFGERYTYVYYRITNGVDSEMWSGSWTTPDTWSNPIAGSEVSFTEFSGGLSGVTVNMSGWANGTYTVTAQAFDETSFSGPTVSPSLSNSFVINVPSACKINTFSCDGNATLAWGTSNCSSVSISPSIGSVPTTGNTQGQVGTAYTLTADSETTTRPCPAPSLNSSWQENGGSSISKTVTPGQQITLPLNFSNTGASGSVIKDTKCQIDYVSGIPAVNVSAGCDNIILTAP